MCIRSAPPNTGLGRASNDRGLRRGADEVFDGGATVTGQALDARVGGSPFNVALGLARLQQAVAFCSALSTGFLGQRLLRTLRDEGVDTSFVDVVDAPTSMCIVGLDARGVPSYEFHGERGADRQLSLAMATRLPAHVRVFCFGSYTMVVEPVASTQRALIERVRHQTLVAYDPNVCLVSAPLRTIVSFFEFRSGSIAARTSAFKMSRTCLSPKRG